GLGRRGPSERPFVESLLEAAGGLGDSSGVEGHESAAADGANRRPDAVDCRTHATLHAPRGLGTEEPVGGLTNATLHGANGDGSPHAVGGDAEGTLDGLGGERTELAVLDEPGGCAGGLSRLGGGRGGAAARVSVARLLGLAHLSPRLRPDDAADVDAAPRLEILGGLLGLGPEISVGSVARQGDADGQQILLPLADGGPAVTAPQERLVASARRPGEGTVADHAVEDAAWAGGGNE